MVEVRSASCAYGDFLAVDGVSLTVPRGGIHALLGTNGAGKTTLLETIQGFRRPESGEIRVFGADPWRRRSDVAGRTGTMLQESGLVDEMTVSDQLSLWKGVSVREDQVERVLDLVGLAHRRKVPVAVLSGGERRRLDFAMALWGDPELVVLDEPTTGLDPQSRRTMWSIIRDLNDRGTTVLLTTHYLDEAQNLADSVTILDRGRTAVEGSMSEVLAAIPARITFDTPATSMALSGLWGLVAGEVAQTPIGASTHDSERHGWSITIHTPELQDDVAAVIDWARANDLRLGQFRCAPASLEEVFFEMPSLITGKAER
ncbi:Daunorubicin/doxorubicin resistance ATP-binding protein DrrA [Micromonospora sp. MW-13]|uniref:ABC transporter ATP-binding protein n=1 Tax=Micromonospora sp. MW-13 TaxID=2094022 RepID=UPI000ECFF8DB|nr:ABC transporter ATP-binding protein [Micromonospora sp. MW-13]RGC65067.1 Daunorubicin/doxorubicin resistance ATP-binding protein DrrA [Micromonospora sp. MW-13]